jgi:phage gp46-like protein
MIDVLLRQTQNDGDVIFANGTLTLDNTLSTAVYLSLFGGNQDDDVSQNSAKQFWGNFLFTDTDFWYRSETQYLLYDAPLTSAVLLKIEEAVKRDLAWLLRNNLVKDIEVSASIIAIDTVKIIVNIDTTKIGYEVRYGDNSTNN